MIFSVTILPFIKQSIILKIFWQLYNDNFFEYFGYWCQETYWAIIFNKCFSSPFWNNCNTLALFIFSGRIPVINDWFITRLTGFTSAGDKNLSSLMEIPSCPGNVWFIRDFIIIYMWSSSTISNWNKGSIFSFKYVFISSRDITPQRWC